MSAWLKEKQPDILLMQELKGAEFPAEVFRAIGYESAYVPQKAYNGVAILSNSPIEVIATALAGDDADLHARYLETRIHGMRVVNVYAPNGNPIGSENFRYKLAWMDRLAIRMERWLQEETPTLVGGDMNVIPEDIDCHKPTSWMRDALFQPEPRERYRKLLAMGYTDAFRSLHPNEGGHFTYWDYFRQAYQFNRGIRIDHFLLSPALAGRLQASYIDKSPRELQKPSDHTPIVVELR